MDELSIIFHEHQNLHNFTAPSNKQRHYNPSYSHVISTKNALKTYSPMRLALYEWKRGLRWGHMISAGTYIISEYVRYIATAIKIFTNCARLWVREGNAFYSLFGNSYEIFHMMHINSTIICFNTKILYLYYGHLKAIVIGLTYRTLMYALGQIIKSGVLNVM